MRIQFQLTALLLASMLWLPACLHERDETHILSPQVTQLIINVPDRVELLIVGSRRDTILINESAYYRIESSYEFSLEESDSSARITMKNSNETNHFYGYLEIHVPAATPIGITVENAGYVTVRHTTGNMKLSTEAGNIRLSEVNGIIFVQTMSGIVNGDHLTGAVHITAGEGDVELNHIRGCHPDVTTEDFHCDTAVYGTSSPPITVFSQRNTVYVNQIDGDILIDSGTGTIAAAYVTGDITAAIDNGDIFVEHAVGNLSLDVMEEGDVFAFNAECEECHIQTASGIAAIDPTDTTSEDIPNEQ